MSEELAYRGAAFTVYADPPWLLHLAGELDRDGVSALTLVLEDSIRRGGTIGFNLAGLDFMDSTGINALCDAARAVGERGGRMVLIRPTPQVVRIMEICGLVDRFDISDDPTLVWPDEAILAPGLHVEPS